MWIYYSCFTIWIFQNFMYNIYNNNILTSDKNIMWQIIVLHDRSTHKYLFLTILSFGQRKLATSCYYSNNILRVENIAENIFLNKYKHI